MRRKRFGAAIPQQYITAPPANPTSPLAWQLDVSARSRADGSVVLYVVAPGPGRLSFNAKSAVRVESARASRHGHSAGHGSARHGHPSTTVATRVVAATSLTTRASIGETVAPTLTLAPSYRSLAGQRGGLSATVSVIFSSPGHPVLRQSIPVTFVRVLQSKHGAGRHARRVSGKR